MDTICKTLFTELSRIDFVWEGLLPCLRGLLKSLLCFPIVWPGIRLLFRVDGLAEGNSTRQYTPSPENKTKLPLTSVVATFSSKQLMSELMLKN